MDMSLCDIQLCWAIVLDVNEIVIMIISELIDDKLLKLYCKD